jgi:aspartate kinase
MKFGGSSLANAERINNVAEIVAKAKAGQVVVVVSAMQGVTDLLIGTLEAAYGGNTKVAQQKLADIHDKHQQAVHELSLEKDAITELETQLASLEQQLQQQLEQVVPEDSYSKQTYDAVVSFGERTSVLLLAAALQAKQVATKPVTASELIVTNDRFGDAEPLLDASTKKTVARLQPLLKKGIVPVVTGFIGATKDGLLTTLGRGGSDYTSTILGYCLDADEVTIWTDVTGVMTADPRVISDAQTISALSYEEAAELSFYGAKVLHPLTMLPASQKNIPIYIKNTFDPSAAGTRIYSHRLHTTGVVKAVTTLNGLSMITVRGTGEFSPVYLPKMIDALLRRNIDILVLIQSSSDHNTVLMVRSYVAEEAAECILNTLVGSSHSAQTDLVHIEADISVVAVVGAGIHTLPGMVAEVFSSLAVSGIEARAIAYGSSKHNLSFAIKTADTHNAVRSLHQAFQLVEGNN